MTEKIILKNGLKLWLIFLENEWLFSNHKQIIIH